MPKFGSHIMFAERILKKRPDLFPEVHMNALRFGAIGPDATLFMFDPATNRPELRAGIETALSVLETMQDIKDRIINIKTELEKPVGTITDYLTGGLSTDLSYAVEASIEAMILATKLGVALGVGQINVKNPIFDKLGSLPGDFIKNPVHAAKTWFIGSADTFGFPFRLFGHPFTVDGNWRPQAEPPGDYKNWWWMDMLHYRHTGKFASRLLNGASSNLELSYAKGYMTHVAGDITGHPFINSLVGGPFRNHAYRHLVLETLADTWLWNRNGFGDILDARLQQEIDLGDNEVRQIADLIINAMKDVYQPPMVPSLLRNGYPEPREFVSAYRIMKQYLRLSTSGGIKRPEPPPDSFAEVWEEIKDLLQASKPGPPPTWNGNAVSFLVALFTWFSKGLFLLIMIATLPLGVLVRLLTIAPRWILYFLSLALFSIVSAIRVMLCLAGWGYAGKEDFETFPFLANQLSVHIDDFRYPYKTLPDPKIPFYWLAPPPLLAEIELDQTIPILAPSGRIFPDWMMSSQNSMDPSTQYLLEKLNLAHDPAETRSILNQLSGAGFGNAVDFGIALLDGSFPVPDLDLDGDRGYGFRGWEVLPPNEGYV